MKTSKTKPKKVKKAEFLDLHQVFGIKKRLSIHHEPITFIGFNKIYIVFYTKFHFKKAIYSHEPIASKRKIFKIYMSDLTKSLYIYKYLQILFFIEYNKKYL